jgi:hypothetical protein
VAQAAPEFLKEQVMKISYRIRELAQSASLTLVIAAGAACTADTSDSQALDQATSDLKGGVPANSHGKGKNNGEAGAAGSIAGGDQDAGVAEGPGKSKKPKKDKATKAHGNSASPSAGDADEDAAESSDESTDADESADESADADDGADETI